MESNVYRYHAMPPCASTHHKQDVDDDQNDSDDVGAHVQIAPHDDDQYRMYRRLARSVNNLNTRVLQLLTKTEFPYRGTGWRDVDDRRMYR